MQRREVVAGIAAGAAGWSAAAASVPDMPKTHRRNDPYVVTDDGTRLFVKDWGRGEPLLFVASAGVGNDIWQYQHAHFLTSGHRVVAFDRRGHGRSSQPGDGYAITGAPTAALLRDCRYLVYEGAPHGLMLTHLQRLNTDLAAFIAGRESWLGGGVTGGQNPNRRSH
jgi:pimeloyl-ACP methyl ester carboxylesterase